MVPKVDIRRADVDEYIGMLELLFLEKVIFSSRCFSQYPCLKKILKNSKNEEADLKSFFEDFEKRHLDEIEMKTKKIRELWEPLNDKIMKVFEEIHEIKWGREYKEFKVRIVLSPVNSRYLDYFTFDVFYGDDLEEIVDTFLHELSHFIFFEKFKRIYPKINSKNFEHPHLIWKLSEIMPGIILQDERIQKIFKNKKLSVYENIKSLKVNGKLIISIFQDFYDNKNDFEGFVRECYNFMKENQDEIEKQF